MIFRFKNFSIFLIIFIVFLGFIIISPLSSNAFESTSTNFEVHGADIQSITGMGNSTNFTGQGAGGQLSTGISTNIKKVFSGILYWLNGYYTPRYEQIHYRWRNDDGDEQNATWAEDEDIQLTGLVKENKIRIRFEISNEGWTRGTDPTLQIEYAETETCSSGSYTAVPTGSSGHWQMIVSGFVNDGDPTSNFTGSLTDENNTFSTGQIKTTGNETTAINITSENFTEVEYSIQATTNATDGGNYCFRLTNHGSVTNFVYTQYAKVRLNSLPVVSSVQLNGQNNIDLIENSTTEISATALIVDADGYDDIASATGKIYRSNISGAENCTLNDNNCYQDSSCILSGCSGNQCTVTCTINMQYHADPTDSGTPWADYYWRAWIRAVDDHGSFDEEFSPVDAPEVNSLLALSVTNIPNYGNLGPGDKNDPLDKVATVTATGNIALDLNLYGDDMIFNSYNIDVTKQHYSLSSGTAYADGTVLQETGQPVDFDCPKTTINNSPETKDVWWGIEIPATPAGSYTGTNTFEAVKDSLPWP